MKLKALLGVALVAGIIATASVSIALARGQEEAPPPPEAPGQTEVRSDDGIPPDQCNLIHNIDACYETAPAPIDDVEVVMRESFPVQYALRIVSGLPSGCAQFEGLAWTLEGTTITVQVDNLQPKADSGLMCTTIYGTKEHTVELGTDLTPGETYTVVVNDTTITFVA